jgi:ABC-2 type transport system ATP-binding protein
MIKLEHINKTLGTVKALDDISATIKEASIFGLVGSNGAGKSTMLRVMSGAIRADSGRCEIDGEEIFENDVKKQRIIYLSDDQFFFPNTTIKEMSSFFASVYNGYDQTRVKELADIFKLETGRKVNTFSKGMQKQTAILLALAARPKYLLCDETFDGLDPVMRQLVKKLLASEVADRGMTPIIASHNLRELEDICDHVGLLHKGGILFEKDIDELKLGVHKIQCVFTSPIAKEKFAPLDIKDFTTKGSLITMTVKGELEEINAVISALLPVFYEAIPLTLEEIFINEMEGIGYDIRNIII